MKQLEWQDLILKQDSQIDISAHCIENADKMVDLTLYMVDTPVFVLATDKMSKVLGLFRHMQLKMLPVLDPC